MNSHEDGTGAQPRAPWTERASGALIGHVQWQPPKWFAIWREDNGLGSPPRIQSPLRAARYTLRLSKPQQAAITLSASVDADVARVFWFDGDSFIAATAAGGAATWSPGRAGRFRLSAVDDHDRADTREVQVDVVQ